MPLLHAKDLEVLAKQFAEAIPENELSVSNNFLPTSPHAYFSSQVAALQGYFLKNKVGASAGHRFEFFLYPVLVPPSRMCRRSRGMGQERTRNPRKAEKGERGGTSTYHCIRTVIHKLL